MTWVFAVLIVLALGGVALVAAGRGTPMSEEHDDRPDVMVPDSGPLEGHHLRRIRFSLAFRGYRMAEVDALLDRVARQLDQSDEVEPDPARHDEPRSGGRGEGPSD